MDFGMTSAGESCGVFGMYDLDGGDVATTIYYGLYALQHRGQESAGIAVTDTAIRHDKVFCHKALGRVNEVFDAENIAALDGNLGVGHVNYPTAGASTPENSQPLVLAYILSRRPVRWKLSMQNLFATWSLAKSLRFLYRQD